MLQHLLEAMVSSYTISFCLGSQVDSLSSGIQTATPGGIFSNSNLGGENEVELLGPCGGDLSVIYDGYTYPIVEIGNQCWFAENLRATNYNDGSAIPKKSNNTEWSNDTLGAYSCYSNNDSNCNTKGSLYNWHAINNPSGICPSGWKIPTHNDFTYLERQVCNDLENSDCDIVFPLDESNSAGIFLGTNEGLALRHIDFGGDIFGHHFNIIPTGCRLSTGSFLNIAVSSYFWSSSSFNVSSSWSRSFRLDYESSARGTYNKKYGFTVRCLKE